MRYDLITAKQAVKDLFPQLANKHFSLWQSEDDGDEQFRIQEHNGQREYFGNVYHVDLKAKTLTN